MDDSTGAVTPDQIISYLSDQGFTQMGTARGAGRWQDKNGRCRLLVPPKIEFPDDPELIADAIGKLARRAGTNSSSMAKLIIDRSVGGLDWDYRGWPTSDITVAAIVMSIEGCGENDTPFRVVTSDGRPLEVLGAALRHGTEVHLVVGVPA